MNSAVRSTRLKVAVVGAAFAHSPDGRERFSIRAHLPALKRLEDRFEVVAICTTKMASAQETADHFGVPFAFDDLERMLAEVPEIDIVAICVRPSVHHRIAMPALRARKHVYCELPMALSTAQAQEMYDLACTNQLRSQVGYQHHYEPASLYMGELVRGGFIGRPLSFSHGFFSGAYIAPRPGHRTWLFQSQDGGHPGYRSGQSLQRLMAVLGADVSEICADMRVAVSERRNTDTGGVIRGDQVDNMNFLIRVGEDTIGTMQCSYTSWFGTGTRFELYGTHGMLMLATDETPDNWTKDNNTTGGDPTRGNLRLFGAQADLEDLGKNPVAPERMQRGFRELPVPDRLRHVSGFFEGQSAFEVAQAWSRFSDAIWENRETDLGFLEAMKVHYVLDAAERSVQSRAWERVDYTGLGDRTR